jgi:hypothetical protein
MCKAKQNVHRKQKEVNGKNSNANAAAVAVLSRKGVDNTASTHTQNTYSTDRFEIEPCIQNVEITNVRESV